MYRIYLLFVLFPYLYSMDQCFSNLYYDSFIYNKELRTILSDFFWNKSMLYYLIFWLLYRHPVHADREFDLWRLLTFSFFYLLIELHLSNGFFDHLGAFWCVHLSKAKKLQRIKSINLQLYSKYTCSVVSCICQI